MFYCIKTKAISSPFVHNLSLQRQVSQVKLRKVKGSSLSVIRPRLFSGEVAISFLSKKLKVQAASLTRRQFVPRIEKHYKQIMCFDLLLQCSLSGIMSIPSPNRMIVSNSSKSITQDKKELMIGLAAILLISSQKPQITWAKKSIAGFKLREGEPLGCKVTLRGRAMYAFLDKLTNITLTRARPMMINHGINSNGAYQIGVGDSFQFYELEHHFDLFQSLRGFDVALLTASPSSSPRPEVVPGGGRAMGALLWSGLQLIA